MDRFLNSSSPEEKEAFMDILNELQVKDSQYLYNSLSARCFNDCVNDFRNRELIKKEKNCITNCASKYLKLLARVGVRFQEENAKAAQAPNGQAAQMMPGQR